MSVVLIRMTRTELRNSDGHRTRIRSLGLPASAERALMGEAYENYATAQAVHVACHNSWRRLRRVKGTSKTTGKWSARAADRNPQVKAALTKASKAAMLLADAKAQYRDAKAAAQAVAA